MSTIALVSVIKNEGAHLNEWLTYHEAIGVTHFYIFDNESTDNTRDILKSWEIRGVTWKSVPKADTPLQIVCLNSLHQSLGHYDFAMCLDGDELFCPNISYSLVEMLDDLSEDVGGVVVNWRMFGERSNADSSESQLSITNCSFPEFGMNKGFKSIVRTSKICTNYFSVHRPPVNPRILLHDFEFLFVDTKTFQTPYVLIKNAQINHYRWRSEAEFKQRLERGDLANRKDDDSFYRWHASVNYAQNTRIQEVARYHKIPF